nr:putative heat shock transcription factor HSF8 [Arabidopsis thaliana]
MLPENNSEKPPESFMEPNLGGSSPLLDPDLLIDDSLSFDIDDFPMDSDIDPVDYGLLERLLMSSPVPDNMDSTPVDNETEQEQNGWDKTKHMDNLTQQMGLLSPETLDLSRQNP